MKLHRLAATLALPLLLAGCQSGGDEPSPDTSVEDETPASTIPSDYPDPTPLPNQPSDVESMNDDESWDDWGADDPLPSPGPEQHFVQFIRLDFTDPDAIQAHLRIGIPETFFEGADDAGASFCGDDAPDAAVVGFGSGWSAERSERDGYVLCDTTSTFALDEWGDDALIPTPTLSDGVWDVDFQEAFWPESVVALYRFRMEFGGDVIDASEGGRVDGDAVTWHGPAALSASAESGE